jgi:hypothetical protein
MGGEIGAFVRIRDGVKPGEWLFELVVPTDVKGLDGRGRGKRGRVYFREVDDKSLGELFEMSPFLRKIKKLTRSETYTLDDKGRRRTE